VIKQLILRNFRSYEEAIIDLHPGVNVIWGESDEGKTNILRGWELLTKNRPRGAKWFPHFLKKGATSIRAVFDDVDVALRKRVTTSKVGTRKITAQKYYMEDRDEPFEGFKTSVPPEIKDAINLEELNVQKQHDPAFLQGGSKLTRIINDLTGLEVVDDLQSTVNTDLRNTNAILKDKKDELKQVESDVKNYDDLAGIGIRLQEFKQLEVRCDSLYDKVTDLRNAVLQTKILDKEIFKQKRILDDLKKYEKELIKYDTDPLTRRITVLEDFIEIKKRLIRQHTELTRKKYDYATLLKRSKKCPYCFGNVTQTIDEIVEEL
jgi:recombinational DNA repair ATPase RecF